MEVPQQFSVRDPHLAVESPGPTYTHHMYDTECRRTAKGSVSRANLAAAFPVADSCTTPFCAAPIGSGFNLTRTYLRGVDVNQDKELNDSGAWMHTNIFAAGGLTATYWNSPGTATLSYNYTKWLGTKACKSRPQAQACSRDIRAHTPLAII